MDFFPDILFFLAFGGFAGYFVYRMIRHGGFKGAMFGARVVRTVGEIKGERQGPVGTALRVHLLSRESETLVGVELVAKSFASYQTMPLAMSAADALHLSTLLQEAASGR